MAPHSAIFESSDHRHKLEFDSTLDRVTICHSKNIQRPRVMRRNSGPPRFAPQQLYPEAWIRMLAYFPNNEIATRRRKGNNYK